ncbi:MAG: histone-like nucleoid-structuring protein Lsr2 [Mycobacteriales bacterium]
MAQRVKIMLVCDLHDEETPGSETILFSLDGASYEIDACDAHAAELRSDFARYLAVARRSGGRRGAGRTGRRGAGGADRQKSAQVREWARSQGLSVSERGRIPASLLAQYEAAH